MAGGSQDRLAVIDITFITKPGIVTIAGRPSDDMAKGTVASILRQAGIRQERKGQK